MFRDLDLPGVLTGTVLALLLAWAGPTHAAELPGLGLELRPQASTEEIGLPVYPGALPRKDPGDSGSGLTLALSGGREGFRMSLLKVGTPDPLERVAQFYRSALAAHGQVIDCSRPPPATGDPQGLRCDEKAAPGSVVLKVGTKQQQRIVSLKAVGGRVEIDLVRLVTNR